MTNIVFSPALQAPITLSNPTGSIGLTADLPIINAKASPVPPQGSVSLVGIAVKLALAMATNAGSVAVSGVGAVVTPRIVTQRQPVTGAIAATGAAPTLSVASANVLTFPRIMSVIVGGDQGYGRTNGYPWTTAAAGTAANAFVQNVGAYDIAILNGTFEGWDSNGTYDRENLTTALLKTAVTYTVKLSNSRQCLPFYYQMMMSGIASGGPSQQYFTLVQANNWWLYQSTGGAGTITPAGGGASLVNYSAAWPGAIGSAGVGASICGSNYGTTSLGSPTGPQGPARTMGNYAALKLLIRNSSGVDSRFTFNPQMASPSCGGIFLDNCFVALDGSGNVPNSSLDGISLAPGSQQGGGFPGLDTVQPVMARGNRNMFDQLQIMARTYQSGSTFYNFANFGQYANKYQFGVATLTCGLENTLHGGLLENALGAGLASWECFQQGNPNTGNTIYPSGWPNLKDNYYQGMDFCQAPKMVGLGTRLPAIDGSQAASWPVGAGTTLTQVTAGSALEYQLMRYGLCTTLLDDGYFAPGVSGTYDWSKLRWYDEYGDDSLTQVNVKRGYLGTPLSTRPTSATWAQGPMGVWSRQFTNGIAIVNPRGNGSQTVTLPKSYQLLTGTQQPTVNTGAVVSSLTIPDGDGRILILPTQVFAIQSLVTGINNGLVFQDDTGGNNQPGQNQGLWLTDGTGGFGRLNWASPAAGTAGFRWLTIDQTLSKGGVYIKYDIRRTQNQNSKELKLFGNGYPNNFSNFTTGCNVGGYSGTRMGLSYSDSVSGGDINTQFWLDAAPTLTGGSSYSRTPHPTINVHIGGNEVINGKWQTIEWYIRHNTDGNPDGEMACWLNGTLIFWAVNVYNCRTGGQGFNRVDIGGYAPTSGTIEDYRNFSAGYFKPTGRGIG